MSVDEKPEAPMYVYESTVHCTNVLLCLNDQRKQDILCDVTVLVEGKEFRGHRAVLAACSEYFLQVLVGQSDNELVISLPEEVTARGFAPLLQFAYTAKLLLSRENIQEVIRCADFLRVHNLEDSCFRFLEAQLRSEEDGLARWRKVAARPPSSAALDDDNSEDESMEPEAVGRPLRGPAAPGRPGPPGRRTTTGWRWPSPGRRRRRTAGLRQARGLGPAPVPQAVAHIKAEPREEEPASLSLSGDEQDPREKDGVSEMETDGGDHSPMSVDRPKGGARNPTCLRSFFSVDLTALPNASHQLLANSRLACPQDKGTTQGDHKKDYGPFPGELGLPSATPLKETDGFPPRLSLKSASCDGVCKQEAELDRRSVIFSSGACDRLGRPGALLPPGAPPWTRSCPNRRQRALPLPPRQHQLPRAHQGVPRSPPSETRTRTSSSCSSYSYAEDGSGGSPCSLPQFEFSSSPCSNATRCLAMDQQDQGGPGDALFGPARPKIKCEQSYGTNSSDESGSFSEGTASPATSKNKGQRSNFLSLSIKSRIFQGMTSK
ncbi:hypothetical protein ANANG_G00118070 [Anguilla anguilla]|uniref:BTB domain-containing protein n=1 Tax=Anguilla anguilla TaxID=7936 RepID=A0A9D3RZ51_ANGAN|nr:hypothetical protein ANANG_G00118070 [Anguilla anguilla]